MPDPLFPFKTSLSLRPLVDHWTEVARAGGPLAAMAQAVLALAEGIDPFQGPTTVEAVRAHPEALEALLSAVVPPLLSEQVRMGVSGPFDMTLVYGTAGYRALPLGTDGHVLPHLKNLDPEMLARGRMIHAFEHILQSFYGHRLGFDYPLILEHPDDATGLPRYYKLAFDARYCRVVRHGDAIELSEDDLRQLTAYPMELDRWSELLPPERFSFEGFSVITAVDVTDQEVLSDLKNDLLQPDALRLRSRFGRLEHHIRALMRQPDLDLGMLYLEYDEDDGMESARAVGHSLLVSAEGSMPACTQPGRSVYGQAAMSVCEPCVAPDLGAVERSGFEEHLWRRGYRSLLVAPLHVEDRLIGLLELASRHPGRLNRLNTAKLQEAAPLFATALKRSLDEREDRVQAVIRERYTAIHPAIEWRFRQAALDLLAAGDAGQAAPIVFRDVYPLYGLVDIRGSSAHRADAIRDDLLEQMGLALTVIEAAGRQRALPVLDELAFRIRRSMANVQAGLSTEAEHTHLDFLHTDVEGLFDRLATFGDTVAEPIARYRDALDPDLGVLYREREAFEQSVTLVNDTIATYLDEQQRSAQAMLPHYFEKYKTDGVDYNIYVGASLLRRPHRFGLMFLRNLRLWQLMVHCELAWALRMLRPHLPLPLDVTHLVLAQSQSLAIRFRQDEKKFDVDGAYNIRYEIVKKRIDKATIRGTSERLTQPDHLAIVYGQAAEAAEYGRYVEYLQAIGYLADGCEVLDLEDLQGLRGLKALRVRVRESAPRDALPDLTGDGAAALLPAEVPGTPLPDPA